MLSHSKPSNMWHWMNQIISLIAHPIFMPFYSVVLYFYVSPRFFLPQNIRSLYIYLIIVSIAIPLLFLLVLRFLKIIDNFQLKTPHERLFFSVIMASVYFIIFKKLIAYHDYLELFPFFFGIFLSLAMLAVLNYQKMKPSIHAMSMAGSLTFFVMWSYYSKVNILSFIAILVLISAIAISARIYLNAHTVREIVMGLLLGISMQIISFYYILEFF